MQYVSEHERALSPPHYSSFLSHDDAPGRQIDVRSEQGGYLPCHYFDYVSGTSTGGLNALQLGRLRMNVSDCVDRYPQMATDVFGNWRLSFWGAARPRYACFKLINAVQEIIDSRKPHSLREKLNRERPDSEYDKPDRFPVEDDLCRTYAVTSKF